MIQSFVRGDLIKDVEFVTRDCHLLIAICIVLLLLLEILPDHLSNIRTIRVLQCDAKSRYTDIKVLRHNSNFVLVVFVDINPLDEEILLDQTIGVRKV